MKPILALETHGFGDATFKEDPTWSFILHIIKLDIWQLTRGFGGTLFSDKSGLVPGGYALGGPQKSGGHCYDGD